MRAFVLCLLVGLSSSVFAKDKEVDFFQGILGPKLEACKKHFDISDYLIEAIGADQEMPIDVKFIESLQRFRVTGELTLSKEQTKNAVAVKCASFAEGMLAHGLKKKDLLKNRVDMCSDHFDISIFPKIVSGNEIVEPEDSPVIPLFQSYSETGHLPLSPDQSNDPLAVECASYAEGILAAGFTKQIVDMFAKVIGESLGQALKEMAKSTVEIL